MRSTATAAAIIQPHRAHASTWYAYIDMHQQHPHAQVYLEQTAPPIRASRAGEETKYKCFINSFGVPDAGNQVAPGTALNTEIRRAQHLPIPQRAYTSQMWEHTRIAALSTPFILGAAWATTHMERALGRSPCVDILGDSLGRAAHGERSIRNSAVRHLQESIPPLPPPPPPSSSRTAPTPVHGMHT